MKTQAKKMFAVGESVGAVANLLHHEGGMEWHAAKAYAQTLQIRSQPPRWNWYWDGRIPKQDKPAC